MAKFSLFPLRHDDPFGDDSPTVVDVPDKSAPASGFRFSEDVFLPTASAPASVATPFGDGAPVSPVMRVAKVNLVPALRTDSFAGLGDDHAPSSSAARFNLAPMAKGSDFFEEPSHVAHQEREAALTKGAQTEFHKFAQFTKIQETDDGNVMVWGVATHEKPDLDGELCDYDAAKDAYQQWSLAAVQRTSGAGQEISLGPIRKQHTAEPAGKATKISYDDDAKEIWLGSVPISDDIRKELQNGFLTGYSQGGSYAWRNCTQCDKSLTLQQANNFCPNCKKTVPVRFGLKRLSEVSYVDSPCTGKGFEYVKQDGSSKFVGFAKRTQRPSEKGVTVLSKECIYSGRGSFQIWKFLVELDGLKRTVIHSPSGVIVV